MKQEKLATVTVTYNRKELLLKNIKSISNQEYPVDCIIIIDNHSIDGSKEAVISKFPELNIKYIYLEENTGGAGGFYEGCKFAYENNFDWIVLMDDDGNFQNKQSLKNLMKMIEKENKTSNDKILWNSVVLQNEKKLTFGLFDNSDTLEFIKSKATNGMIKNKINPFNGTLLSRGLIEKIGYPRKDFFITTDEYEYFMRAKANNANIATIVSSLYYHPSKKMNVLTFFGKKIVLGTSVKPTVEYYRTRNYVYVNSFYKKDLSNHMLRKILLILFNDNKFMNLKMMLKGYHDGKKGKLGKTINL